MGQINLAGINTRRETFNTGLFLPNTNTSDTPSLKPITSAARIGSHFITTRRIHIIILIITIIIIIITIIIIIIIIIIR